MVSYNGLSKFDNKTKVGQSYPLAISYPLDKKTKVYTIRQRLNMQTKIKLDACVIISHTCFNNKQYFYTTHVVRHTVKTLN